MRWVQLRSSLSFLWHCLSLGLEWKLSINQGKQAFLVQTVKNPGDLGSLPGSERSPEEGNNYPLQYSCLENSKDREAWWATVHGVAKSPIQMSDWIFYFQLGQTKLISNKTRYQPPKKMFNQQAFFFFFLSLFLHSFLTPVGWLSWLHQQNEV